MIKAVIAIAVALAACTDEESPETPTCEELGADPDAPLFCTADGLCTYDGQACTRIAPDGGIQ